MLLLLCQVWPNTMLNFKISCGEKWGLGRKFQAPLCMNPDNFVLQVLQQSLTVIKVLSVDVYHGKEEEMKRERERER